MVAMIGFFATAGCSSWLLGVDDEAAAPNAPGLPRADAKVEAESGADGDAPAANQDSGVEADAGSPQGGPDADAATSLVCTAPAADCDGKPANGCETNLSTALQHCGTCSNACSSPANGSATCVAGQCGIRCANGYTPSGSTCVPVAASNACTAADYAKYADISYCFISQNQLCGPATACSECGGGECCAEATRSGRKMYACLSTSF